jgi:hypothetical protein
MGKKRKKSKINLMNFIIGVAITLFSALAIYVFFSFWGIFNSANETVCIRNRGTLKYVYQMYNAIEGKKIIDKTMGVAFLIPGGYLTPTQAKSESLSEMVWRVYENGAVDVFCDYNQAVRSVYNYRSSFFGQDNVIALKGSWRVGNGMLYPAAEGDNRAIFGTTSGTDYTIEINAQYLGGSEEGSGYGIYYRVTEIAALTGYLFQFDAGEEKNFSVRTVAKGKVSAPFQKVSMQKAMGSKFDLNLPHDIKIEIVGQTHTIMVDGVKILNFSDASFSSGSVGVRSWNDSNIRFNKVSVTKK